MPAPPIRPTLYPTLATAAARTDEARASLTGNETKALPPIDGSGSVIRSATRGDLQLAQLAARKTGTVAVDAAGEIDLLGRVRRSANNAERRFIALQRDRVPDRIFLYKALGGGWQAGAGDAS